jgi:cytoskeletal protein RodZ
VRSKRSKLTNSKWKYLLLALLLAVAVITVLELLNVTNFLDKKGQNSSNTSVEPNVSSDKEVESSNNDGSSAQSPSPSSYKKPDNAPAASIKLIAPSNSSFISAHNLSYSANKSTNLSSVCKTSPGATCYIAFTKNGIIKSLRKEKTDAEGAAYWKWTLAELGITQGTWQVKAVASYNSQTKTAYDAMDLKVGP